jgi:predicted DNA-binding protein
MKTNSDFRNVRLQIFVSADVDDRLSDLSKIMGLHKNELIRVAIANYLFGVSESVSIVRDVAEKKIQEEFDRGADGVDGN